MSTVHQPRSIHDSRPREQGGVIARRGFDYQDHVAASLCLDLALDPLLSEVWCETFDDVTLIWESPNGIVVEFVQIKSNDLQQYWTPAKLCERTKANGHDDDETGKTSTSGKKPPLSILETSLIHDCYVETPRFRIVTAIPTRQPLQVLTLEIGHKDRKTTTRAYRSLVTAIQKYEPIASSENGNNYEYWVQNTRWDVRGAQPDVANECKLRLMQISENFGHSFSVLAINELLNRLLRLVKNASDASWSPDPVVKKLKKQQIVEWLADQIADIMHTSPSGSSEVLRNKMAAASIATLDIESAVELRRFYNSMVRSSSAYLELGERSKVEPEILFRLMSLRAKVYSGEISSKGIDFHVQCLNAMEQLHELSDRESGPPAHFYAGCMYEVTNRCRHQFDLITT